MCPDFRPLFPLNCDNYISVAHVLTYMANRHLQGRKDIVLPGVVFHLLRFEPPRICVSQGRFL